MQHKTYSTRLIFDSDVDKNKIIDTLKGFNLCWNECSKIKYNINSNSIILLHEAFYKKFRKQHPCIPSALVIEAQRSVLTAYKIIRTNKYKITSPPHKKKFSLRLNYTSYSYKNQILSLISLNKRVKCRLYIYEKLKDLLSKYTFGNPLITYKNNDVWIHLPFEVPETKSPANYAVGVDLGIRNHAATSEGNIYQDKQFNGRKRKLRHNKDRLKSVAAKGSKSAKRKIKKLRHTEANINKNFAHHISKRIVKDTKADVIVLENLKGIKNKKHKYQYNSKLIQACFSMIRKYITFKALENEKTVIVVNPAYTSQIDHRTGIIDGKRNGSRYIGKDGQLLHADINAACNIALRSKLPCLISNYFAWQAKVNTPIVGALGSQTRNSS